MLFLMLVSGCSQGTPAETTEESSVVVKASFYPLAHFTEQVLGDLGTVESLTPLGTEPHSYEPSAKTIASLYESDLFVFNGAMLDPWAEDLAHELEEAGVVVIDMSSHFELHEEDGHEDEHGHEHGDFDPHIWLDPVLVQEQVALIRDALIALDPENATTYRDNAARYLEELEALDTEFKTTLASCSQDTIIVAHDAFGYLGERYGFEILAITGLSPEDEPSAGEMADLVDLAEEHNLHYVFFEALTSPELSETIALEIGAQTLVLNPLEGLIKEQVASGETYLSIMRQNLVNLSFALECQ